jgi:hypothetical protein
VKKWMLLLVIVAACKQGKGDRCQITDDCQTPLVCSTATSTCVSPNSTGGIDAMVPDAKIDAPTDAPRDATTLD